MSIFKFKKFLVNQEGCPMKINTDGALLGALADVSNAKKVLDIGTGTGVIALMLAQKNKDVFVDAIDIDGNAAFRAKENFKNSSFAERMQAYHVDMVSYFDSLTTETYDLIVSNPPYFIDSLKSTSDKKNIARHTDFDFFEQLLAFTSKFLESSGALQLVVPVELSINIQKSLVKYPLYLAEIIHIKSFENSDSFRHILKISKQEIVEVTENVMVIYEQEKVYSKQYSTALADFFTIF